MPRIALAILVFSMFSASRACVPMKTPSPGMPAIPACKMCGDIEIDLFTPGSIAFSPEKTDMSGACAVRTMLCTGTFYTINQGPPPHDKQLPFTLTYNADKQWVSDETGQIIENLTCIA